MKWLDAWVKKVLAGIDKDPKDVPIFGSMAFSEEAVKKIAQAIRIKGLHDRLERVYTALKNDGASDTDAQTRLLCFLGMAFYGPTMAAQVGHVLTPAQIKLETKPIKSTAQKLARLLEGTVLPKTAMKTEYLLSRHRAGNPPTHLEAATKRSSPFSKKPPIPDGPSVVDLLNALVSAIEEVESQTPVARKNTTKTYLGTPGHHAHMMISAWRTNFGKTLQKPDTDLLAELSSLLFDTASVSADTIKKMI
jgi:hypothetical protein